MHEQLAHNIADRLLEIKAVKLNATNPFTWASGLRSPVYCDNRSILSYPEIRKEVVDGFILLKDHFEECSAIAGVATAGIAWGALLADRLGLPFAYVRSKAKSHGLQNQIEGQLPTKSKVMVIEDLISTGGSSMDAALSVKASGFEVCGVMAIFQYGFPSAISLFEKNKLDFKTLSGFEVLLERALLRNYINQSEYENLKKWNQDPYLWSESFQE